MSQNNDTKILLISLVITLSVIGGGAWWFLKQTQQQNNQSGNNNQNNAQTSTTPNNTPIPIARFSEGDSLILQGEETPEKQTAVEAIKAGNYTAAVTALEASLKSKRNDPEALIYLNNARIGNEKSYAIAASMPIGAEIDAAKEMLRGIAQAQNEINVKGGINGISLKVIIADDANNAETAKQVGEQLAKNSDILGVIGNFGSEITLASAPIYQQQGLVLISPTSTSVGLSGVGNYIFRTVPSDRFMGNALSNYLLNKLKLTKAVVFFNSKSNYSSSLKDVFTTNLFSQGGEVVGEFDFSSFNFNAADALKQANSRGAQVIMLAPNSATLDQALQVIQVNDGKLPLLGGDSTYKPKTLQIAGKDALGMVVAVPWHILGNPNAIFPKAATQLWGGDVNWRTAMAYDATQALITALQQSPNPTRESVQQALSNPNFSAVGAAGEIRFLPSGDRNQAVQLVKIELGKRSGFGYDFIPIYD